MARPGGPNCVFGAEFRLRAEFRLQWSERPDFVFARISSSGPNFVLEFRLWAQFELCLLSSNFVFIVFGIRASGGGRNGDPVYRVNAQMAYRSESVHGNVLCSFLQHETYDPKRVQSTQGRGFRVSRLGIVVMALGRCLMIGHLDLQGSDAPLGKQGFPGQSNSDALVPSRPVTHIEGSWVLLNMRNIWGTRNNSQLYR